MNRSIKSILTFGFIATLLSSCVYIQKGLEFSVITPKGAPSLAFHTYDKDKNFTIESNTSVVKASFTSAEHGAIIFDTMTGLKLIEKQGAQYKLARVITAGNLFFVSTGNDTNDTIDDSDNIISFGENLLPDQMFKKANPNINVDVYKSGVSELAPLLCTGKYEGSNVDYLVMAEPIISTIMSKSSCSTNGKSSIVFDVTSQIKESQGNNKFGFPQAGLFIRKDIDEDDGKKDLIKNMLQSIDQNILDIAAGSDQTSKFLIANYTNAEAENTFGINGEMLQKIQMDLVNKKSINKLGYFVGDYPLNDFTAFMGLDNVKASSYSNYYSWRK